MHYDTIIIGAGMSGLAAGIRLAYFDRKVVVLERHRVFGGLNSFYTLGRRKFDVGLHALTNFVPQGIKNGPLPKLLRQLRISREELDLREQSYSEVRFPDRRLRFSNGGRMLTEDLAELFPDQIDGFERLVTAVKAYDDTAIVVTPRSARQELAQFITDPVLVDMLLCPLMYYGSAQEHDMDFTHFVTLFKSLYLEGFARPRDGVRVILKALVKKFRQYGGKLRMGCGVRRIQTDGDRVAELILDDGETISADAILSSAGYLETMRLCAQPDLPAPPDQPGRLSFVESISCTDLTPAQLGIDSTIIFFNDAERFCYARPDDLVDVRSGVICCPNNYQGHQDLPEGIIRITSLANYDRWAALGPNEYAQAKEHCYTQTVDRALAFIPEFRDRVVFRDMFTPRTIERFTGHLKGAVYGAPGKLRDGRTWLKNLFICGTDQGFLGIVGAILSGISMANMHVLARD